MNFHYLLPRLIRHYLPEPLTRFLLGHNWFIRPGLETSEPLAAVERYHRVLASQGISCSRQRILIFGYGGGFAACVELLRRGAAHVVLCDRFALPDHRHNLDLLPAAEIYLLERQKQVLPRPEFITLVQDDIRIAAEEHLFPPVDLVLSTSVLEHLPGGDMGSITTALTNLTKPLGFHLHFIDLRDHFFKYPFEMLTFSESTWRNWLNPTSNLNRYRLQDYRSLFEKHFQNVEIQVLERDSVSFEQTRNRIRPEFLNGDNSIDAVTSIQMLASLPIKQKYTVCTEE